MNRDKATVLGVFSLVLVVILSIPPLIQWLDDGQINAASPTIKLAGKSSVELHGQFRGLWLQVHNNDVNFPFEDYVREIANTGADTVCLSVAAYQENCSSSVIFIEQRKIPSPDRLVKLIQLAKSLNKRVILMPIVLLEKGRAKEWRGMINPEDWASWWQYYTDYILLYANIAESNGVDLFMVGSELVSTEDQTDKWQGVIQRVRDQNRRYLDSQFRQHLREKFPTYKAADFKEKFSIDNIDSFDYSQTPSDQITPALTAIYEPFWADRHLLLSYSSNWDHYKVVKFWDSLDAVGMTSYYNLNPDKQNDPTLESLLAAWQPIKKDIFEWQQTIGKPVIFTEVGWCSQQGSSIEPWNYYHSTTVNLAEQQRCMDSFLKTFSGEPWVGGILVWKWRDSPEMVGGEADFGYTPVNKPVMKTIQNYFAMPNPGRLAKDIGKTSTSQPTSAPAVSEVTTAPVDVAAQ